MAVQVTEVRIHMRCQLFISPNYNLSQNQLQVGSRTWFLKLWYAYHNRYTNNWLLALTT